MEYITIISFGAIGLVFAVFSHLSLTRSRQALEAEQQLLEQSVQPQSMPEARARLEEGQLPKGLRVKGVYIPRSNASGRVVSSKRTHHKPSKVK